MVRLNGRKRVTGRSPRVAEMALSSQSGNRSGISLAKLQSCAKLLPSTNLP